MFACGTPITFQTPADGPRDAKLLAGRSESVRELTLATAGIDVAADRGGDVRALVITGLTGDSASCAGLEAPRANMIPTNSNATTLPPTTPFHIAFSSNNAHSKSQRCLGPMTNRVSSTH